MLETSDNTAHFAAAALHANAWLITRRRFPPCICGGPAHILQSIIQLDFSIPTPLPFRLQTKSSSCWQPSKHRQPGLQAANSVFDLCWLTTTLWCIRWCQLRLSMHFLQLNYFCNEVHYWLGDAAAVILKGINTIIIVLPLVQTVLWHIKQDSDSKVAH